MAKYKVFMTVDSNGGLHYHERPGGNGKDLTDLHVQEGDEVKWHSDDGDYAVLFLKGGSPFQGLAFSGKKNQDTQKAGVQTGTAGITYPYLAVVGPNTDDPNVIVDNVPVPPVKKPPKKTKKKKK